MMNALYLKQVRGRSSFIVHHSSLLQSCFQHVFHSIDVLKFQTFDISCFDFIHVPEGAIPKDGPSAGITMLTALASVFQNRPVQPYMAMTGEITLRGKVLPVGGIKEKILAAKRAGIKKVVLCKENEKHVNEIEAAYIKGLKFQYVDRMEDVLKATLK